MEECEVLAKAIVVITATRGNEGNSDIYTKCTEGLNKLTEDISSYKYYSNIVLGCSNGDSHRN